MTSLGRDKPCPPTSADGPKPIVAALALVSSRGDQPVRGSVQPAWSVQPAMDGPAEQHQHSGSNLVLEDLIPVLVQITSCFIICHVTHSIFFHAVYSRTDIFFGGCSGAGFGVLK